MFCKWTSHLLSLEHDQQKGRVGQYQNISDSCFIFEQDSGAKRVVSTFHWILVTSEVLAGKIKWQLKVPLKKSSSTEDIDCDILSSVK